MERFYIFLLGEFGLIRGQIYLFLKPQLSVFILYYILNAFYFIKCCILPISYYYHFCNIFSSFSELS